MLLTCKNLTLEIREQIFFKNLSFSCLTGVILFIKGRNGSGKTTLLRTIAGIKTNIKGEILLNNQLLNESQKPYANYIGHKLSVKADLTVIQQLKFWASMYDSIEAVEAAIHYFQLASILNQKCYSLSSGWLKRIALSRLLACEADIWLLDEAETNLDDESRYLLNNLIILKANNGGIICLTSHNIPQITTIQTLDLSDFK